MAKNYSVFLSFSLLLSFASQASLTVPKADVHSRPSLGDLALSHKGNEFYVTDQDSTVQVNRWNLEKDIRGISTEKLAKCLALGARFDINRLDNGEYKVSMDGRLKGGGPTVGVGIMVGGALLSAAVVPFSPAVGFTILAGTKVVGWFVTFTPTP